MRKVASAEPSNFLSCMREIRHAIRKQNNLDPELFCTRRGERSLRAHSQTRKPWGREWQAKLIVRSVVKWNEFCGIKKVATTLICCTRLTQCSKSVKNRKKPVFKIYSSRFPDHFERLSAEATFRTPAHTAKCGPCSQGIDKDEISSQLSQESFFQFFEAI